MKEEPSRVIQLILEERAHLIRELSRVDRFLRQEGIDPGAVSSGIDESWTPGGKPRNSLTKLEVMESVLRKATKPLRPRELVIEMKRAGYAFASNNPANTLNPFLYGKKRRPDFIHRIPTGFIHAERKAEYEDQKRGATGQPGQM